MDPQDLSSNLDQVFSVAQQELARLTAERRNGHAPPGPGHDLLVQGLRDGQRAFAVSQLLDLSGMVLKRLGSPKASKSRDEYLMFIARTASLALHDRKNADDSLGILKEFRMSIVRFLKDRDFDCRPGLLENAA